MIELENSNVVTSCIRHLLAGLVIVAVAVLCGYLLHGVRQTGDSKGKVAETANMPSDVDGVIKGYIFSEYTGSSSIEIKGRQVVRRGRLLLGVRTNLAKTCYFEKVSGELRSQRGKTFFAADDAEWGMTSSSPMILHGNIAVRSDGGDIHGIRKCRIYLKSGVIELFTDHSITLHFK